MAYLNDATSKTPAHIIYLIDASGSMAAEMPGTKKRKIDFVSDILEDVAYQVFLRSRRGNSVSNRYNIAMYAYNDGITDVTNGKFLMVKEFLKEIPEFGDLGRNTTNMFSAFQKVRDLLIRTIPHLGPDFPAPIVCHLTDGEYTKDFGNPSSIMKEIMNLETPDGKVILENIFLGNKLLAKPIDNANQWEGVESEQEISDPYTKFLYEHSSHWPDRYVEYFNETFKFHIKPGTRMFFPAEDVNIARMAFTASTATPIKTGGSSGLEENSR